MLLGNRSGARVNSLDGIERHTSSLKIVRELFLQFRIHSLVETFGQVLEGLLGQPPDGSAPGEPGEDAPAGDVPREGPLAGVSDESQEVLPGSRNYIHTFSRCLLA